MAELIKKSSLPLTDFICKLSLRRVLFSLKWLLKVTLKYFFICIYKSQISQKTAFLIKCYTNECTELNKEWLFRSMYHVEHFSKFVTSFSDHPDMMLCQVQIHTCNIGLSSLLMIKQPHQICAKKASCRVWGRTSEICNHCICVKDFSVPLKRFLNSSYWSHISDDSHIQSEEYWMEDSLTSVNVGNESVQSSGC